MKTISLGVLFAVVLISAGSCQWRHRSWRNHHEYVYNPEANADRIAGGQRGSAEI